MSNGVRFPRKIPIIPGYFSYPGTMYRCYNVVLDLGLSQHRHNLKAFNFKDSENLQIVRCTTNVNKPFLSSWLKIPKTRSPAPSVRGVGGPNWT